MTERIVDFCKITMLVIDDESEATKILGKMLKTRYGSHKIICTATIHEALERMETEKPDIFVIDLHPPLPHAFGLLDKIFAKQHDALIIVVSGSSDRETIDDSYRAGVTAYITKPIIFTRLCDTVDHLMREILFQKLQSIPPIKSHHTPPLILIA